MPSKRNLCQACQLPTPGCICATADVIPSALKISVLQHPDEQRHPKNTLRLAQLCLPNLSVYVGETPVDFAVIAKKCAAPEVKPCVIFPAQRSDALETVARHQFNHLIFIDATWRKAFKIWSINHWLQALPCYHFTQAPASQYHLRKTTRAKGLSSLEAIAYGLSLIDPVDVAPLYATQQAWMDQKRALMPKEIQKRYEP
ncbi:tRNA-uridine aminocarboxypropyltransferase [Simiduia curdlanivorans]|uniref:tRNA-uridine aminocarboxypropyltransferase n=1 Tax=Simiduia curdlanivorans TaxID=1492769 RepID=A0ABV8V1I9_9GAMM|nr:tRNA-uridine aminocarboxypropyltransferase [Simiduia curdlanivorans]MDN3638070.1 tRNA-uridine aminocarboxypropyltransferase [Simiduia curdlanivorans]